MGGPGQAERVPLAGPHRRAGRGQATWVRLQLRVMQVWRVLCSGGAGSPSLQSASLYACPVPWCWRQVTWPLGLWHMDWGSGRFIKLPFICAGAGLRGEGHSDGGDSLSSAQRAFSGCENPVPTSLCHPKGPMEGRLAALTGLHDPKLRALTSLFLGLGKNAEGRGVPVVGQEQPQ